MKNQTSNNDKGSSRKDEVRIASEGSFPTSDAPSYWAAAPKQSESTGNEERSDWIESSGQDPRMPTAPEYVEVGALAREHGWELKTLIDLARRNPKICKTSTGNPWTESSRELLFMHESAVLSELQ